MRVVKNQIVDTTYVVEKHSKTGVFLGAVSGMGRNTGKWDSEARSKRTAQRWAMECRTDDKENIYSVAAN